MTPDRDDPFPIEHVERDAVLRSPRLGGRSEAGGREEQCGPAGRGPRQPLDVRPSSRLHVCLHLSNCSRRHDVEPTIGTWSSCLGIAPPVRPHPIRGDLLSFSPRWRAALREVPGSGRVLTALEAPAESAKLAWRRCILDALAVEPTQLGAAAQAAVVQGELNGPAATPTDGHGSQLAPDDGQQPLRSRASRRG